MSEQTIGSILAARPALQAIVEEIRGGHWEVLGFEGAFDLYTIKTSDGNYVAQLNTRDHLEWAGNLMPLLAYVWLFVQSPNMFEALLVVEEWINSFDACPWCGAKTGGDHQGGCPRIKIEYAIDAVLRTIPTGRKF